MPPHSMTWKVDDGEWKVEFGSWMLEDGSEIGFLSNALKYNLTLFIPSGFGVISKGSKELMFVWSMMPTK